MSMPIAGHDQIADRPDPLVDAVLCASPALIAVAARTADRQRVHRRMISSDRRGVRVSLTASGRDPVREVGRCRRSEISNIVQRMEPTDSRAAVAALRAFAQATGAVSEEFWSLRTDAAR